MSDFINVNNMKLCLKVFEKYMNEKYNVSLQSLSSLTNTDVKVELYNLMLKMNTEMNQNEPLKEKNQIVINNLKDLYVTRYNIQTNNKSHVRNLDRENLIYGDRKVNINNDIKPEITNIKNEYENVSKQFEILQKERLSQTEKEKVVENVITSEQINPIDPEELVKQFKLQQDLRNCIFETKVPESRTLYENQNIVKEEDEFKIQNYTNFNKELIIEKPKSKTKTNFLIIYGSDRDINNYPNRFKFNLDFTTLDKKYTNVTKIKFLNLIVPIKISNQDSHHNSCKVYGLYYPYLYLNISEFSNIYDGFNDITKDCFSQFIFDKVYQTANGRNFLILKNGQNDDKIFENPLSMLQRMEISINKPNGVLFDNGEDSNSIYKIEYEEYNTTYLKIVTYLFFDKNDFFKGDNILIKNFDIDLTVDQSIQDKQSIYKRIKDYINRKEGHEILELGKPNDNGFYRSFYVSAPLIFDENCGKLVTDKELLDAIVIYSNIVPMKRSGNIINSSLQFNITCQIDTIDYVMGTIHE